MFVIKEGKTHVDLHSVEQTLSITRKCLIMIEMFGAKLKIGLHYKNILTIVSDDRKWTLYYKLIITIVSAFS